MKRITRIIGLALLALAGSPQPAVAQGTAFTYQGRLNDGNNPANGSYDFRFGIYNAVTNGVAVGGPLTNAAFAVSNGLFTVTLDFGAGVFTGANRWLEIAVRTNGGGAFTVLAPRQALTPTPYALYAPNAGAAATASTATTVAVNGVANASLQANAVTTDKIADGTITDADINASGISASKVVDGDLRARRLKVGLNHTLTGTLATIAGGTNSTASADLATVGGGQNNSARGLYATVGGGAGNTATNRATVSGGAGNSAGELYATVGGGEGNNASRPHATVGGGDQNGASGPAATVGGGTFNIANAYAATIGGGQENWATNNYATVAGGLLNVARGPGAFVGGGGWDGVTTGGNTASGAASTIGGGLTNIASGGRATVGGGQRNTADSFATTIAGGFFNSASGLYSTVGGGSGNAASGDAAVVGGGGHGGLSAFANTASGTASTIGGGDDNTASGLGATVGGGIGNDATNDGATVGGGQFNTASGLGATVGGGQANTATNIDATVPGGLSNTAGGARSFAAGHRAKALHDGAFVWADLTEADFSSSANNQFLIRAGGGVGIGTTTPAARLHVAGNNLRLSAVGNPAKHITLRTDGAALDLSSTGGNLYLAGGPNINLQPFSGNVGIGRDPAANKLEVEGNASKTSAGNWLANSDARIKQQIEPVTGALAKLAQVRPVSFRYTDAYRTAHPGIEDRRYLNVVAQEFREVFPDHVQRSGEKLSDGGEGILQVDIHPLTIYSVAAIQELHCELERRDTENAELKQRLSALEKLIQSTIPKGE